MFFWKYNYFKILLTSTSSLKNKMLKTVKYCLLKTYTHISPLAYIYINIYVQTRIKKSNNWEKLKLKLKISNIYDSWLFYSFTPLHMILREIYVWLKTGVFSQMKTTKTRQLKVQFSFALQSLDVTIPQIVFLLLSIL